MDPVYVTIREMHSMEDKLLGAIVTMETRILTKMDSEHQSLRAMIGEADVKHEHVHDTMRLHADERHRRIDDFIDAEVQAAGFDSGRHAERSAIVNLFRYLNEFRWLVALIFAFILFVLNDVNVSVGS